MTIVLKIMTILVILQILSKKRFLRTSLTFVFLNFTGIAGYHCP